MSAWFNIIGIVRVGHPLSLLKNSTMYLFGLWNIFSFYIRSVPSLYFMHFSSNTFFIQLSLLFISCTSHIDDVYSFYFSTLSVEQVIFNLPAFVSNICFYDSIFYAIPLYCLLSLFHDIENFVSYSLLFFLILPRCMNLL